MVHQGGDLGVRHERLIHDTVYNPPSNSNRCEDKNLFEVEKGLIKLTGVEDTV